MIKHIDLFMPPKGTYLALHEFTKQLGEALKRQGIECRILEAQHTNPKPFLDAILHDPPDCTLSFNGLLPDKNGRFFCDMINIPHVACLVDAPQMFLALTQSSNSIITSIDRHFCESFLSMDFPNALFMPLAAEAKLAGEPLIEDDSNRPYDVLMPASFFGDHDALRTSWKQKYHRLLCDALDEAIETTFNDTETSYIQALAQAIEKRLNIDSTFDVHSIDMMQVLDELERYIKGKDRVEIVKGITDAEIHIVGNDSKKWKEFLGSKQSNVIFHDEVSYSEIIKMMKKSKIVLNSSPGIKNGAHDRVFIGLAAGALVLTNENIYMNENFESEKDILYYRPKYWSLANDLVNKYLADSSKRYAAVKSARKKILEGHTWDHRAATLLKQLDPILQRIKG